MSAIGLDRSSGGPARSGPPTATVVITAVVNGTPQGIRAQPETPLLEIVREALEQTRNKGRSLDEWTVTNASGRLLDTARLLREYGLEDGDTLFIQVSVGAGGETERRNRADRGSGDGIAAEDAVEPGVPQLVDPAVSRAKFEWELGHFLQSEAVQRRRGILVVRAAFPKVLLAFATPDRPLNPLLFGVLIDYTDYDHTAPSIELVDPFTERPYQPGDLPSALTRRVVTLRETGGYPALVPLVSPGAGARLSVCVPGARHYYEHPAVGRHAWAAARVSDAGGLTSLVDQLRAHVIEALWPTAASPSQGSRPLNRREL